MWVEFWELPWCSIWLRARMKALCAAEGIAFTGGKARLVLHLCMFDDRGPSAPGVTQRPGEVQLTGGDM